MFSLFFKKNTSFSYFIFLDWPHIVNVELQMECQNVALSNLKTPYPSDVRRIHWAVLSELHVCYKLLLRCSTALPLNDFLHISPRASLSLWVSCQSYAQQGAAANIGSLMTVATWYICFQTYGLIRPAISWNLDQFPSLIQPISHIAFVWLCPMFTSTAFLGSPFFTSGKVVVSWLFHPY